MQIGSKGQEHGQFMFPFYVHVSLPGGDVWVADPRTRMVQRFDGSTGLLVSQLGAGESEPLKYPNGVVTMGDYVIASDSGMHRIRKYDLATGKELTRCGKYGRGQGEFNHPGALAVRSGHLCLFTSFYLAVTSLRLPAL